MIEALALAVAECVSCYSDCHKEAYGFRPRGKMPELTLAEWACEFERLGRIAEGNRESQAASELVATREFEERAAMLISMGAKDRAAVIRWFHQARGTEGDNESLCYSLGLPYGYFK